MRRGVSRPSQTPTTALRIADSEALSRKQIAAGILCDPKYNARKTVSPGERDKFCSAASRLTIQIVLPSARAERDRGIVYSVLFQILRIDVRDRRRGMERQRRRRSTRAPPLRHFQD